MPTLTVQPSDVDAYIKVTASNSNFTDANLQVLNNAAIRSLLSVDFSALTNRAIITSATLSLYHHTTASGTPSGRTYEAKRVTQLSWVETEITWNEYSSGNSWATGGGDFTADDEATSSGVAVDNWLDFDVKDQVVYARDNTSDIAYFIIMDSDESGAAHSPQFYSSRESTQLTFRPKLVIEYIDIDDISTDKPPQLYSGIKEAFFNDYWRNEKYLYVQQTSPHPCIVQFVDVYAETENEE